MRTAAQPWRAAARPWRTAARPWRPRGVGWLRLGLVTLGALALLVAACRLIWPSAASSGTCRLVARADGGWALLPTYRPATLRAGQRDLRALLPPSAARPRPARPVHRRDDSMPLTRECWWLVPADRGRRCYLEAWRWSATTHRPVRWLGRDGFSDRRPAPDAWFACAADPLCAHDNSSSDLLLCVDGGLLLVRPEESRTSWLLPPQGIVAAADTKAPIGTLAELGPRWLPESRTPEADERLIVARTRDALLLHPWMSRETFRRPLPASLARDGGRLALLPDGGLALTDGPRVDWLSTSRPEASPAYRLDRAGRVVERRAGRPGLPEYGAGVPWWLRVSPSRLALALLLAVVLAWRSLAPTGASGWGSGQRPSWSRQPGRGQVWALMGAEWRASASALAAACALLCLAGSRLAASLDLSGGAPEVHADLLLGLAPGMAWIGLLVAAALGWWQVRRERWDLLLSRVSPARLVAAKVAAGLSGVASAHLLAAAGVSLWLLRAGAFPLTWAMVAPSYRAWLAPCSAWLLVYALALWLRGTQPALRWQAIGWMGIALVACLATFGQLVSPTPRHDRLAPLLEQLGPPEVMAEALIVSTDGTLWTERRVAGESAPWTVRLGALALRRGQPAQRQERDAGALDWALLPPSMAAVPISPQRHAVILRYGPQFPFDTAWYAVLRPPSLRRYHVIAYRHGQRGPTGWISRRGWTAQRPGPEDDLDLADGGLVSISSQRISLCDRDQVLTFEVDGRQRQVEAQLAGLRAAVRSGSYGFWLADDHRVRLPDGTDRPLGSLAGRRLYVAGELRDGALLVADGPPRQTGTTLCSLDAAGDVIDQMTMGKGDD